MWSVLIAGVYWPVPSRVGFWLLDRGVIETLFIYPGRSRTATGVQKSKEEER